jgi:hypothetical protein
MSSLPCVKLLEGWNSVHEGWNSGESPGKKASF